MRLMLSAGILGLIAAFAAGSGDAAAAQKKKKANTIKGTIVMVDAKGAEEGTLTVKVTPKKKKNEAAPVEAKEVKVRVAKTTKIERSVGKKKDVKLEPAVFSDLQSGRAVVVTLRAGQSEQAERVVISSKKKKKAT